MTAIPDVILKKKSKERIRYLHPWIYKSDIEKVDEGYSPGDIVCVRSAKNSVIGYGYINPKSEIAIRLLSREEFDFDAEFIALRVKAALEYRKGFIFGTNAFRVVHSEGDFLPGLIVDKYGDILVMQFLTLGMDARKGIVVDALKSVFSPGGIYERSDVNVRKFEGLDLKKGWLYGAGETVVEIEENGAKFLVDIEKGHKTGFYLDQRENRKLVSALSKGKDILDCFSYTGGFSIAAGRGGAKSVLGIDASKEAVELAGKNAALNGLSEICEFKEGNVFDELKKFEKEGRRFDVIFLDPPTFTKSKAAVDEAYRGYKEINLRAMKILNGGGYLLTSSCSHHVTDEMFKEMLKDAASDARRTARVIARGSQAKDHPVILSIPETEYLKAYLVQVL